MKRGIIQSYLFGIRDTNGETYKNIFKYFLPELVTVFVLYSALYLVDGYWIAHLKSTSTYAAMGVTNSIMHFLIKIAEGISVGTIILVGQHNGTGALHKVGRVLIDTFWITCIFGLIISGSLYFGAYSIYSLFGVSEKMILIGVPYLRIRAIGIFFAFLYFAFVGFLRGIKNTKMPMYIFVVGAAVFVFFDYVLIFGNWGFPRMQFNGSALATTIQYATMFTLSAIVVFFNKENKKYGLKLFSSVSSFENIKRLLMLSCPIVIDKATMAGAYIWLGKMIAPMGTSIIASLTVIKDLERIIFLPALASVQIITFLVSNDFGASNYSGIKSNIKKILLFSSVLVLLFLIVMLIDPRYFISFFDKKGTFTDFSARVFPLLSVFIFLDVTQLILSGALRGLGEVKTVMFTRLIVCLLFFVPFSYMISILPIEDLTMKFCLIYGSFYICNGMMTVIYINKFRSFSWQKETEEIQDNKINSSKVDL